MMDITLGAQLHSGRQTLIYRGYSEEVDHPIIVKILGGQSLSQNAIARFKHEYNIVKDIKSPNIAAPIALTRCDDRPAIVMRDMGSLALAKNLPSAGMDLISFFKLTLKLTQGLITLHESQIVHKDLNPHNIVVSKEIDKVQIIDFGLATQLKQEQQGVFNLDQMEGTIEYISPEQTGLINASIDARSDLYSLGITLYQCLTGSHPFSACDALGWVHCHVAQTPPNLCEVSDKDIPEQLNLIILKLLKKDPEDRYRSAEGFFHDIERCYDEYRNAGVIRTFTPGRRDPAKDFLIPNKLYGREKEKKTIALAYEQALEGKCTFLEIFGGPGVGKSALIHELRRPVTEHQSWFGIGSFDQFKRDVPYSALIEAIRSVFKQILSSSGEDLKHWKTVLSEALGNNAGVITEVVEELGMIIGPPPLPPELGPKESRNRFNLTFRRLIHALSQTGRPFVIFLDNCQWSDQSTFDLIEYLLETQPTKNFLFVAAYRSDEISAVHPLIRLGKELDPDRVFSVCPNSLSEDSVAELLKDALLAEESQCKQLSKIALDKTEGNPFFLKQYIEMLYHEKLITFDINRSQWVWDQEEIRRTAITDNVVELMVRRLRKLPEKTQLLLAKSSFLGNAFRLKTLSALENTSISRLAQLLKPAIDEAFIVPWEGDFQFLLIGNEGDISQKDSSEISLKFAHDRVKEAAYHQYAQAKRESLHLTIAEILIEDQEKREENLFEIVSHINTAKKLLIDQDKKIDASRLNLRSGQKAKRSAAHASAVQYFREAKGYLETSDWDRNYDLILEVYCELSESEYIDGNPEESTKLFEESHHKARTIHDKTRVGLIQMKGLFSGSKNAEALELGLKLADEFGISINQKLAAAQLASEILKHKLKFRNTAIEDLYNLPEATNPEDEILQNLLSTLPIVSNLTNPLLSPLIGLLGTNRVLLTGKTRWTAYVMAICAVIYVIIFHDYSRAHRYAQLSLRIAESYGDPLILSHVLFLYGTIVNHWKKSIRTSLPLSMNGFEYGVQSGDFTYASWGISTFRSFAFFAGVELKEIEKNIQTYNAETGRLMADSEPLMTSIIQLSIDALSGKTDSLIWENEDVKEADILKTGKEVDQGNTLNLMLSFKYNSLFMLGHSEEALEFAKTAEKCLGPYQNPGYFHRAWHSFYYCLIVLDLWNNVSWTKRQEFRIEIEKRSRNLRNWMKECPENFKHMYCIVQAEFARVSGREDRALRLYNQGIESARKHQFLHHEALGRELEGKYLLSLGCAEHGAWSLRRARTHYALWGASGKVNQLEKSYPDIFQKNETFQTEQEQSSTTTSSTSSSTTGSKELDVETVIKASQAISREVMIDGLLKRLMHVVIESAGARQGMILLEEEEGLFIEAKGKSQAESINVEVMEKIAWEKEPHLSKSVIQYAKRMGETVVLQDVEIDDQFKDDHYLQSFKGSLLCSPIIHRGKVTALLYLENELIRKAFSERKVALLNHLCSQIAISIENAKVYSSLEELVRKRTEELVEAQQKLVETARRAGMSEVAVGILHNVGNMMTSVTVSLEMLRQLSSEKTLEALIKGSSLLSEHAENIDEFILNNPKGQLTIKYFSKVGQKVEEFQSQLIENTKLLGDQITTVNKLISMQEKYVFRETSEEVFPLRNTIKDACRMIEGDLASKKIPFTLDVDHVGEITIKGEQSKFAQMLDNILRNAIESMDNTGSDDKNLNVSVLKQNGAVQISVEDSGEGMIPETMKRMFEQGFSTKDSSRGFGLHISAIFAREMKGKIWAENKTSGLGTIFYVSLPFEESP